MRTLPGNIREKVESLIKEGDSLRDQSRYRDALKPYMVGVSEICYTLFRGKIDHLFAGKEMQPML